MKKPGKQQFGLALSCLVCVIVALRNTNGLEGTEFSGGWLTGPLLSMTDIGIVLFVLALIVTFLYPRIAGAIGLASSLLCLPLYLYFIAPDVPRFLSTRSSALGISSRFNRAEASTGTDGR